MKEFDISKEDRREYRYQNGLVIAIDKPMKLYISDSGSHRVLDADGWVTHAPAGWSVLRWKASNTDEPVQF